MSKLQVSQQRQNLLKQLSSLQEQKDYAAALTVAAEYNQLTEQTCGSESVEAAESLFTFAQACLDVGKPAMAEQPLQRSLALCRRHFGEQLRAGNLNNFATSMLDLGKTGEADHLWQEALQAESHHPEATYKRGLLAWRSGAITDETLLQQLAEVQASHGRERVAVLTALVHLERGSCGEALAALPDPSVDRPEPPDLAAVRAMIQRHTANAPGLLRSWLANGGMGYGLALSPDGRQALSAGMDGTIKLWDTETATCLRTIAAHAQRGLVALAARSDWTQACSAGGDGHLKVWDVATGECLRDLGEDANPFGVTLSAPGTGRRWDGQDRVFSDPEAAAAHQRRRADRERLDGPNPDHRARQRRLCVNEGSGRGTDALSGKRAGPTRNCGQRRRAWSHRNRLQRRHGPRQSENQQARSGHDGP